MRNDYQDYMGGAKLYENTLSPTPADHECGGINTVFTNCGFETGDFTGWITQDITLPYEALAVNPAGVTDIYGLFTTLPTEGDYAAMHGFDGFGPDEIRIMQDVTLPADAGNLMFDYRGAWIDGDTQDRIFRVDVEPSGGGTALASTVVLTATGDLNTDTGALQGSVDVSAFAGTDVRIAFVWEIPEAGAGPGRFQLDNVYCEPDTNQAPGNGDTDFNSDGKSDLIWQHTGTGTTAAWYMDGTSHTSGYFGHVADTDWRIVTTGDFDSDGNADLIWQHLGGGNIAVWYMDGTAHTSASLGRVADTGWRIAGSGDFNADGKADLVWQHPGTGKIAVWYMDGTSHTSASLGRVADTAWRIAAAGDLDADGKPDLIWQHTSGGSLAVWYMDGTSHTSGSLGRVADTAWRIAGSGDFNTDGTADLVWWHSATGTLSVWYMDGTAHTSGFPGQVADAAWRVAGSTNN
jgi:hypothetical protein